MAPHRPQTPPWDGMGTRQRPRLTPLSCGWLQTPAGFYTGRARRFVPPGRGVGFPIAARRTDTARQPTFSRLPVSSLPAWAVAQIQHSLQTRVRTAPWGRRMGPRGPGACLLHRVWGSNITWIIPGAQAVSPPLNASHTLPCPGGDGDAPGTGTLSPSLSPSSPDAAARPSCGTRAGLTPHRVRVVTQPPADIIPINSGLCEN